MFEDDNNDFSLVLNRTSEDIQQEIGDMVLLYPNIKNPVEICEKLLGQYVVIQELHQLLKGRYIRWINPENGNLTSGGIVLDVQFKQDSAEVQTPVVKTGVFILYKTYSGGVFSVQYNNTLFFQKLKPRELQYLDSCEKEIQKIDSSERIKSVYK